MKVIWFFFFIFLFCHRTSAQDSTFLSRLQTGLYIDYYYAYDFNMPDLGQRGAMGNDNFHIYSHSRHNEMALNHAVLGVTYADSNLRGSLSFHTGTYVAGNYADEPLLFSLLYEGYGGIRLSDKIWLDLGIFHSHIGLESAISDKNPTLSRSIMADNSPYYESGLRLSYQVSDKVTFWGLLLNGWQNIVENNDNKAIGTQIQIKPSNKLLINSSTFFGKERAVHYSVSTFRLFHNFFSIIRLNRFSFYFSFDVGVQEKETSGGVNEWYALSIISRYRLNSVWALSVRAEYYNDPYEIIINTGVGRGFRTGGYSIGIDRHIRKRVLVRAEARYLQSAAPIYLKNISLTEQNFSLLASVVVNIGDYKF